MQLMPLPPSPLGRCCPALTWFSTIFSIVHSKGVGWGARLTLCFGWIPLVLRMDRIEVGRSLKSPLWQIRKRALNQGSRRRSRDYGTSSSEDHANIFWKLSFFCLLYLCYTKYFTKKVKVESRYLKQSEWHVGITDKSWVVFILCHVRSRNKYG